MIIKSIAAHLAKASTNKRPRLFRRVDLLLWTFILGLFFIALLTPTAPIPSQPSATAHPASYASPMMPKDVCDAQGNCYPDGSDLVNSGGQGKGGKIKNPIADDSLLFFTKPDLTVGQHGVQQLWAGGVAIVDVFFVVLIAVNGVRIMLSGSVFRYADVAETLPRILIALVAAHISLALVSILLGLNNGLCNAFLSWANTLDTHASNMPDNISFKSIFSDALKGMTSWQNVVLDVVSAGGNIITSLLEQLPRMILQLVALTMSMMIFAQLIIRLLLIDLFTVISAPCIACWALPGRSGQPVTNFWMQGAAGAILSQTLQTVGIIVTQFIFDDIFNIVQSKTPGFFTSGGGDMIHGADLIKLVVYIAMLWFIIRIPSLFRLNPSAQMIMAGGQAVGQAAQGVASAATTAATTVVTVGASAAMLAK